MFNNNFAGDWSRTADLWYRKRLLYQLSHNHFLGLFFYFRFLTNIAQILTIKVKSVDGVLGTQTWGGRM